MKPMPLYNSPIFMATVVLPVPGLPVSVSASVGVSMSISMGMGMSMSMGTSKDMVQWRDLGLHAEVFSNLVGEHLRRVPTHLFFDGL